MEPVFYGDDQLWCGKLPFNTTGPTSIEILLEEHALDKSHIFIAKCEPERG
jgi:hypothetical protein